MEEATAQQDDISDVDLYGDLEFHSTQQISYNEMKEICEKHESTIDELQKENEQLKAQNEILKTNISSLYFTAKNEITRKDAEIKRLQEIEIKSKTHRQNKHMPKSSNSK